MSAIEKTPPVEPEKASGAPLDIEASHDVGMTKMKHADRNDADEALKVFEGESIVLTPEDEKKLVRKIDLYMMRRYTSCE